MKKANENTFEIVPSTWNCSVRVLKAATIIKVSEKLHWTKHCTIHTHTHSYTHTPLSHTHTHILNRTLYKLDENPNKSFIYTSLYLSIHKRRYKTYEKNEKAKKNLHIHTYKHTDRHNENEDNGKKTYTKFKTDDVYYIIIRYNCKIVWNWNKFQKFISNCAKAKQISIDIIY